MNYKQLFPTYRNRYRFVAAQVGRLAADHPLDTVLNLGTGEGDYDPMLAAHCRQLTACDINERDVAFAQRSNADVPNLRYRVADALDLSFADDSFDLVVASEVIEHVGDPERMLAEISRVLRPGGHALLTYPSRAFPVTYDPINYFRQRHGKKPVSAGAYAFGHDYLIDPAAFAHWVAARRLELLLDRPLGHHLVGLLEAYWTGIVQSIFKVNATNLNEPTQKRIALRPSRAVPAAARLTDGLLWIDAWLAGDERVSVGRGVLLRAREIGVNGGNTFRL